MRPSSYIPDIVCRLAAALGGVLLLAWAADAFARAQLHMAIMGTLCGAGPTPHCGWCLAAASLGMAGLAALTFGLRPVVRTDLNPTTAR